MPARKIPDREREIGDEIIGLYAPYLNLKEVGNVIGIRHSNEIYRFVSDIPSTTVNSRKKYRARDIARKLYESEATAS